MFEMVIITAVECPQCLVVGAFRKDVVHTSGRNMQRGDIVSLDLIRSAVLCPVPFSHYVSSLLRHENQPL